MIQNKLLENERHCWFSNEMAKLEDNDIFDDGQCYYLINGKSTRITCASSTMEHGRSWPDMEYLGIGTYHYNTSEGTLFIDDYPNYYNKYDDDYFP